MTRIVLDYTEGLSADYADDADFNLGIVMGVSAHLEAAGVPKAETPKPCYPETVELRNQKL
jgi:hypothetical protein